MMLAVVLGLGPVGAAPLLYDNIGPSNTFSAAGTVFYGQGNSVGTTYANIAQSFVAGTTADIASVEIPLLMISGIDPMLTIHVATDNSGAPGTILQSSNITAPTGTPGIVTATFGSGTTLYSGNTYWIWIFATYDDEIRWQATDPAVSGTYSRSFDYGASWTAYGTSELALRVNGYDLATSSSLAPVPEPQTFILMGLGLIGVSLVRGLKLLKS